MSAEKILSVENLKTYFYTRNGIVKAVDGVSFDINGGESLGLAGESGCGKSITCLSILRLLPQPAGRIVGGRILFKGENLVPKKESEMRRWRGKEIGMILQDPLMSLNPVFTVGDQVGEAFRLDSRKLSGQPLRQKIIDVLSSVNIPSAGDRLNSFPFQFSGGMRQRTVAAISIARSPKLLVADEPTTSLDVTIQDQFLRLLKEMQQQKNMALLLVTHDLGIVAESCDRIAVMYAGRIVETGSVKRVYDNPCHPYTRSLMKSLPRLGSKARRLYQIDGEPPNPAALPPGCSFHPRCPEVMDLCCSQYPPAIEIAGGGYAACWRLTNSGV
jgi:oligopeptide/dipeptide ABC transporter ATP-binding protein